MAIYALGDLAPVIDPEAWVAPNATIIGQVTLKKCASVWWGSILRGDTDEIILGAYSNIQDGSILHTNVGIKLIVGDHVTVGHTVTLHGCVIGDGALIGIGATILNGVVIGKNSVVAARTLIPEGKVFPERSMIMGSPGKVVRELTDEEIVRFQGGAARYVNNAKRYRETLKEVLQK